jgi:glutathione synthase/RimK-type ligase-like ATP-grasp enzyme
MIGDTHLKLALMVTHKYFDVNSTEFYAPMVQLQFSLLANALQKHSIELVPIYWEDAPIDFKDFAAVMPLNSWSYPEKTTVFQGYIDTINQYGTRLINPHWVLMDNMNKSYLERLYKSGAPVPPTLIIAASEHDKIYAAFDQLSCDEIIIKPIIGAGAWRQVRLKRGETLPNADLLPPNQALIQPFLPKVAEIGELSMLFFGNEFSHALMKTPKLGDYRSQTKYGAIETNIAPPPEALEAGKKILQSYDPNNELGYARVDMVQNQDGQWLLMEMEMIEPYLYLPFDGTGGIKGAANFARAIAGKLL